MAQVSVPQEEEGGFSFDRMMSVLRRKDEGIDYETGVPDTLFRAGFSAMDTPEERVTYMDAKLGPSSWFQDSAGRYIIQPEAMVEKFGDTSDEASRHG